MKCDWSDRHLIFDRALCVFILVYGGETCGFTYLYASFEKDPVSLCIISTALRVLEGRIETMLQVLLIGIHFHLDIGQCISIPYALTSTVMQKPKPYAQG
jgi:hypothetical protein